MGPTISGFQGFYDRLPASEPHPTSCDGNVACTKRYLRVGVVCHVPPNVLTM